MTKNKRIRDSKSKMKYFQLFFALIFMISLLGKAPGQAVQAATSTTFSGPELVGNPTDESITINIVPDDTIEYHYQLGTSTGSYPIQTINYTATGGQPHEIVIDGLNANTKYFYRMRYHAPGETDYIERDEHTFWTQRDKGEEFVFTVTSDSHNATASTTQFTNAMQNILADAPDFHIDIGDTQFAEYTRNASIQTNVNTAYLEYRATTHFGAFGHSVPVFLSSGNHEEEEGWNLDDSYSRGVANIQARKAYNPTPIEDGFYTGNTDPLAAIDETTYGNELREDYYAWEWGDALFVVIDPFQYTPVIPYSPLAGEESDETVTTTDQWIWTLGEQQYNWLKGVLRGSNAKYKFMFSHQMVGGIPDNSVSGGAGYVRGGAEAAGYFEWGGKNFDGSPGFAANRPGWEKPIHDLMVETGVSAYFHGHDHQYVYETRDGIVYQETPSAGSMSGFSGIYAEGTYAEYETVEILPSSGHLRLTVGVDHTTVDYVRSDGTNNGTIAYSYTIEPNEVSEPVTVDGDVSSNSADDVDSLSIPHTTGSGDNRLMLVGVSWNCGTTDRTISSVVFTYGDPVQTLTLNPVITRKGGADASNPRYAAIYSYLAPPPGVSGTVTVTFSGAVTNGIVAGAVNFQAVDQTTPLGSPVGSNGEGTTPQVAFSGLVGNELIFDNLFQGGSNDDAQNVAPDVDQTELWDKFIGNANGAASTEQAVMETVSMDWTADESGQWVLVAVPINPESYAPPACYALTLSSGANGGDPTAVPTASSGCDPGAYRAGQLINLTAHPDAGYKVASWTNTDYDASTALTNELTMPDNAWTVSVAYEEIPATGVVTIEGDASSGSVDGSATLSFSHTTGTGPNRLILVGISANSYSTSTPISSVTFTPSGESAIALAPVGSVENEAGRFSAIYSLLNPPSGVTGTMTITFSSSIGYGIIGGAVNFAGVDQTDPLDDYVSAVGTEAAAISLNVTTDPFDMVFDNLFLGAATLGTVAPGADQTEMWDRTIDRALGSASVEEAVGATTQMSWTSSGAASAYYWAIGAVPINPAPLEPVDCYALTLSSGLFGSDPTAEPIKSPGCATNGTYVENQVINLTAHPDWGYEVQAWSGTDNDGSTALTNVLTMPAAAHEVNVTYQSRACYELTLTSGDHGGNPTANPTFSTACTLENGWYVEGEVIELTAHPDSGYQVDAWTGTDNDTSKALTNQLTMPASAQTVDVTYEEIIVTGVVELDGTPSSGSVDDADALSFAHTTGTGTNRLMLVGASWNCGDTDRSITGMTFTYDSTTINLREVITQYAEGVNDPIGPRYSAIWASVDVAGELVEPPAGVTGTLTITFSGSVSYSVVAGVANFKGVNPDDPLGTPNSAGLTNGQYPTVTLSGLGGTELIFDNVFQGASGETQTLTPDAGQSTPLWNGYNPATRGASSTKPADGNTSVTMSWTAYESSTWAITAVPINPAPVAQPYKIFLPLVVTNASGD